MSSLAAAQELPVTPDPASCDIEPVEMRELEDLAEEDFEPPSEVASDLPSADANVEEAIASVVIGTTACTNANEPLRAFAYFTDRFLTELFSEDSALLGHLDVATTRDPAFATEDDRLTVERIDNIRSDGTVALTTVTTSNRADRFVDELTFQQVDGFWLIDAVRPVQQTGIDTATPEGE